MPRLGALAGAPLAAAVLALLVAGCGGASQSPTTGVTTTAARGKARLKVTRIGSLPQAISKASAVALAGGKLMILGGYTGSASVATILSGPPSRLRVVGHLPQPTHDAAATPGPFVHLFGGGSSASTPYVVRIDPQTGATAGQPSLGEPLSDLGAVAMGPYAYLVGGYTGTQFASAILRYSFSDGTTTVAARLPQGTRYAGVAAIGRTIYVAGGLTTAGATRAIYAITGSKVRKIGSLPAPEDHAALAALGGTLYYVGGRKVLAIDPRTGRVKVAARFPASLSDPTATTVGNEIVVAGGGTNAVWALTLTR